MGETSLSAFEEFTSAEVKASAAGLSLVDLFLGDPPKPDNGSAELRILELRLSRKRSSSSVISIIDGGS